MKRRVLVSAVFSVVLLLGLAACIVCDLAISGHLTWSLIPAASIVFAWFVFIPCFGLEKNGVTVSLALLSVLLIPFLLLLSYLTGVREVYSVGAAVSAASIVFLWVAAAVFSRIGGAVALGTVFVLAVPFVFLVNALLSRLIGESLFDVWDMLTVSLLLILACVCFVRGRTARKKRKG